MNWKAYIKIFLIIAILAVIALAAYWFFSQPNTLQSINSALFGQKETPTGNGKSSVETGGLNQLTAEPIFDYWINDKDNSVYYLNEAGSVYKISGTENKLINKRPLVYIIPKNEFKIEKLNNLSIMPLRELVRYCKELYLDNVLEQLDLLYDLGLNKRYSEVYTNYES